MIYDIKEVRVIYDRKLVLSGRHGTCTGLWLLSIAKKDTRQQEKNMTHAMLDLQMLRTHSVTNVSHTTAASVYTLSYK